MGDDPFEHDYYDRGAGGGVAIRWPARKPVAVAFVVSVEYYDLYAPPDAFVPANVPGGFGRGPYPDYRAFSMRDYGSRVGIYRVIEALTSHGIRATLAVDAYTARHRPYVVESALRRDWDLAGHGLSGTEVISSLMSREQERDYIRESLLALERFGGRAVTGWHGPEYGQSAVTPELLAEQGIRYMLDWPNDDRPVRMRVPAGIMLGIPMSADLDDVAAHWHRKIGMDRWVRSVKEALVQLAIDGRESGNVLVLNLHPWLIGQPWRMSYLAELLQWMDGRDEIWFATTDEICRHYLASGVSPA